MRLKGKIATVTGGGGAIGRAIALRLAAEGATLVAADLKLEAAEGTARQAREAGHQAMALSLNVADSASVEAMVRAVVESYGRIDILVNAFGILTPSTPAVELSEADWCRVLDVNLTGVFRCCKAVGALMREQRSGKILNIASINGVIPPQLSAAYSASKAGVLSLTRTLAQELAPFNVQVNAINPGPIDTPLNVPSWKARSERMGISVEQFVERLQRAIPTRRLTTAEDIAGAAAFLASPDADGIVGVGLDVAGGLLAVPGSV